MVYFDRITHKILYGAVLCTTFFCVMIIFPYQTGAQLRPWNSKNAVFVDFSVLDDGATRNLTRSRAYTSSSAEFIGQPIDPPPQTPTSKLLMKNFPGTKLPKNNYSYQSNFPRIKLKPPSKGPTIAAIPKKKVLTKKLKMPESLPSAKANQKLIAPRVKPKENLKTPKQINQKIANKKPHSDVTKVGKIPPPPQLALAPKMVTKVKKQKTLDATKPSSKETKTTSEKTNIKQASLQPLKKHSSLDTINFSNSSSELSKTAKIGLDKIASKLNTNKQTRMQLVAYAGGSKLSSSKARRLSLSRALAIRTYLISKGVRGTRIDVRALGNKTKSGPPNRVDIRMLSQ